MVQKLDKDISFDNIVNEVTIEKDESPIVVNADTTDVIQKETKLRTSEYSERDVTEKEMNFALKLQDDLMAHLKPLKFEQDDAIRSTIPTGIDVFDAQLGGGFATGFTQIIGNPGSGKSALCCKILATGQRKYPGKFIAVYLDSEDSMTMARLEQLGVIYPKIKPFSNLTIEKIFQLAEGIVAYKEKNPELIEVPSVIIWDSIANTLTEAGFKAESANEVLGEKARVLSFMLPKYISMLNKYNIALISINQLRDKIDMGIFKTPNDLKYLGDKQIPGGKSILFNSIQLIYIRPTGDAKGEYGFLGTKVACKTIKNKLFTPNIEQSMLFSFERGFSNFWTNYEFLKTAKRVNAGAWCTLINYPEKKFRQVEAISLYRTDPKFKSVFDEEIKDALKVEIIDKYTSTGQGVEATW